MTQYFIKVVHAHIQEGVPPVFTSLNTSSRYCITYTPGQWIQPALKGSKLFLFQKLNKAVEFWNYIDHPLVMPKHLPYLGKLAWWCEARGVVHPEQMVLKDPPDHMIARYWHTYPYGFPSSPYQYRMEAAYDLVLLADQVKLVHIVDLDEWQRLLGT